MLSKKMRIGLLAPITWDIPPKGYGPWERDVADLAKGFSALGYQVVLFATKQARLPKVKTVAVIDRPLGGRKIPGSRAYELIHIAEAVKNAEKTVDILHNHLNYHPLLFGTLSRVPMVTTLHGCAVEEEAQAALRHYRRHPFISISDAERKLLPGLNYVATIFNPVDFRDFPMGLKPKNYLVYTGRMHPGKGVHNAIEFAKQVELPLYLAGPIQEDFKEYFERQISPHLDNKKVFYLGNLSQKELFRLVNQASAYVGLIEWPEPFGRSVAEAMACGTPVVGMDRGAHREIIKDGISGIVVNSVKEAVKRYGELNNIDRKLCRQTAESLYGAETVIKQHLDCYEKLLKNH